MRIALQSLVAQTFLSVRFGAVFGRQTQTRMSVQLLICTIVCATLPVLFQDLSAQGVKPLSPSLQSPLPLQRVLSAADAPQSLITAMLRDKRGFMWFATETGLVRYDGRSYRQFRPFPDKPSFDNAVTALSVDSLGRLWLGTNAGLYFFDSRTERVNSCPVIPPNLSISALCSDAHGRLWAASGDTLYALNAAQMLNPAQILVSWKQHHSAPIFALAAWQNIKDSPNSAYLLVATQQGLMRYANGTRFVLYDTLFPNNSIHAVFTDNASFVCGTAKGEILEYVATSKQTRRFATGTQRVLSLAKDARGQIWCGTAGDGVWSISPVDNTIGYSVERRNDAALRGRFVTALYRDAENICWFGTSDGAVYKLERRAEVFTFISPQSSIIPDAENLITLAVFEDSEGIVWLGTQRGLLAYNPASKVWRVFRHAASDKTSISADNISCIYEDSQKRLWIGTTGGGVNRFDRTKRTFMAFRHDARDSASLSSNNVSCIYEDSRGRLWIGTWIQGLNLFDEERQIFVHYRSSPDRISTLSSNSISCIGEDRMIADGTLWIGTYEDGLNAFHPTIQAFTRHLHNPQNARSLNSNAVSAIYELADGTLWVTTDAGLNKFNRQTQVFTRYGKANGLPDEPLSAVVGDRNGYIWLVAGTSLCRFNPRSAETRIFDADDGVVQSAFGGANDANTRFKGNVSEEIAPVQFSSRAYHTAKNGTMYFGTSTGFLSFHPDSVRENGFVPPVVLTALKKFNNVVELPVSITEADEIELWYTDNFISFEFAALGFSFSDKNRFRYKLEGFDKYWIDAGTKNEAVYTNLDGGEYVFRVKGSNSDGVWNEEGRALRVIVHPPFWRTRWFYAMCGVLTLGSVWGVFRWRVRNLQKRTDELKRVVEERTSQLQRSYQDLAHAKERTEEHSQEVQRLNDVLNAHNAELAAQTRTAQLEMLRYQLNPHFLFNALISITDLIIEDPKHATRTMTTLMAYLRYALQPPGLPTTPLSEEVKALRSYLAIEQVRFEERLSVHLEIAVEAESVRVPGFLLQPLVENAIKYGMRTSPMPLRIWVMADVSNSDAGKILTLEVINSGTMRLPDGVAKPEGTGTGLKNIRERLQVLFPEKHDISLSERQGKVVVRVTLEV